MILATPPRTQTATLEYDPLYPEFITTAMVDHLKLADDGQFWIDIVESYLEPESKYCRRVGHSFLESFPLPHHTMAQCTG